METNSVVFDKKIQEAAEICADKIDDGLRTARQCAILAYKQGLMERTNAFWHDVSEMPKKGQPVFLMTARKHKLKLYSYTDAEKYKKFCQSNAVAKWAYKEDIINI